MAKRNSTDIEAIRDADYARMQADPTGYVIPQLFGEELWSDQNQIIESVRDHPKTAWRSCHGIGKCVDQDDLIPLASGELVKAKTLIGRKFQVISFLPDGKQVPANAIAADNGVEPVFVVTTVQGRTIRRTSYHKIFAARIERYSGNHIRIKDRGFTEIQNLPEDAVVLVPDKLDCRGDYQISDDEIKLLGYLLGDGGTTTSTMTFTQKDGKPKDEFVELVDRLGGRTVVHDDITLRITGNGENHFIGGNNRRYQLNPILNLARDWGLSGVKSVDKKFPDFVWSLPDRQIALLLNRLFACDGWAYSGVASEGKKRRTLRQIGIALASERMIRDIEMALLRVGVSGNVRSRVVKLDGKEFDAYEWVARTGSQINAFAEKVGIFGKEDAVQKCVESINSADPHYTQKWAARFAPDGYHWEKIKSVEYIGDFPTVAIEVEGEHTFISTVVEHNSFCCARLCLWWLYSFPKSIVITTGPTWRQVEDILWKEIRSAYAGSKVPLGGNLAPSATQLTLDGKEWVALGLSTNDPNRFQGYHSEHLLVIVDEAAGVDEEIFEAIQGVLTSAHCRLVLIGNPTDIGGQFYRAFRTEGWSTGRTAAWDTPNFTTFGITRDDIIGNTWESKVPRKENGDYNWPYPWLITPKWAHEAFLEWGTNHPAWFARVEGEFPDQGEYSVVPLGWIEKAQDRFKDGSWDKHAPIILGVDVARGGMDQSAICARQGNRVLWVKAYSGLDTQELAGEVAHEYRAIKATQANIDGIGLGAGVVDALKKDFRDVNYSEVNVSSSSTVLDEDNNRVYRNLRAELWWAVRQSLDPKGDTLLQLPIDGKLLADLASPQYTFRPGVIQIEDKEETKKRLGRSPDLGDALMLSFAPVVTPITNLSFVCATKPQSRWAGTT